MSYDLSILARSVELPTSDALSARLMEREPSLTVPTLASVLDHTGFLPVHFGGRATGFEIYSSRIDDQRRQDYFDDLRASGEADDGYGAVLERCDVSISLVCKDTLEIQVARAFALALCELARGHFYDPQTGESIDFVVEGDHVP